ncbi:growth hormone receptor a isoform X2 [Latimeria chalumnae]|nr:PREDICTED: growth hormone receptor [Latimeria chalumnae]|eukprot:XP_006012476.2 PREDICTED: growth hormone receptor [Latimeria chalumnae]
MAVGLFILYLVMTYLRSGLSSTTAPLKKPHFTHCRSPEQVTFACWWTTGDYHNLTDSLRVFYMKGKNETWKECPDYVTGGEHGCYFKSTYTSVWIGYTLLLKAHNEDYVYDKYSVSVEDIVQPDPPVSLNWTLLNISLSGIYADIQVRWEAPPSADVPRGWITLIYEVQYKDVQETQWKKLEPTYMTAVPLYSLMIGREYIIRVRCKPHINGKFGEFTDALYVFIPQTAAFQSKPESVFPMAFILIFGSVGLMVVLLFILFSKQQRLKLLLLPPVPVPKINGVDPDLLKKGKLDELSSVLSSHNTYNAELYNDDLWVEFIEVDIDDPEEKADESDTDRLLSENSQKSHNCFNTENVDSGRTSCYEPDIDNTEVTAGESFGSISDVAEPQKRDEEDENLLCLDQNDMNNLSSGTSQAENREQPIKAKLARNESGSNRCAIKTQLSNQSTWVNLDFYAQVSDITSAGGVLLSPGQHSKTGNTEIREKSQEPKTDNNYASEVDAKEFSAISSNKENRSNVEKSSNQGTYFITEGLTSSAVSSCTTDNDSKIPLMPVPDYTSVHMVDSQQSLLLNPSVLPSKDFTMASGYLTSDQLNKVMP